MAQISPGYLTKSQIDLLRQTSLETVLPYLNCRQDLKDMKKWYTPKGPLSVTGQKFMNWKLGLGGGGAIDLVMHINEVPFIQAVSWLTRVFPVSHSLKKQPLKENTLRRQGTFQLPQRDNSQLQQVIKYLNNDRYIPSIWIDTLIEKGTLYADSKANAVFLLLGKRKTVVGAELRGSSSSAWKGMAPGSDKKLGCFSIKSKKNKTILLCESAIDAVSCFMFYPDCTAVSMAGVCVKRDWFQRTIDMGYQLYCAFDTDRTGDLFAEKMIQAYPKIHRLRPLCKDWNDMLQRHSSLLSGAVL